MKNWNFCSAITLCLVGCAPTPDPTNLEPVETGGAYQAQYRDPPRISRDAQPFLQSAEINASQCRPPIGGADGKGSGLGIAGLSAERLSRGDLVDIRVSEDETFSASYVVSRDGMLKLPFLKDVRAQGRSVDDVETAIGRALVAADYYPEPPRVSVRVMDFAGVSVGVTGAVFEPRPVEIGETPPDGIDQERQTSLGASTEARDLANAIRGAGGIRPDADLSAVEIRRDGQVFRLDLRGVIEGRDRADVMLFTGDEIFVPSRQCFQEALMRPGPISPPGVALFLSNLTQPATGNAPSAIGRDVREVPWGTRFSQAVVDTNCVGGARATSARRSAALISRNPVTTVSVVIERDIEDMVRRADRDDYDPYLLPGDSIACYDSTLTNVGEVARILGIAAAAGAILR